MLWNRTTYKEVLMSETRQLLTKLIREEAEKPRHSVSTITDKLIENHYDLVQEWMGEHERLMLSGWVSDILRWDRIAERHRTPIEDVIERSVSGLSLFDLSYSVNDDDVRKKLGEMTGKDHFYVSESYKSQSHILSNYGDLHKKIGIEVGRRLTRTVYTENELRHLFSEYEGKL